MNGFFLRWAMPVTMIAYIASLLFTGPFRWAMASTGLTPFVYAPTAASIGLAGYMLFLRFRNGEVGARGIFFLFVLVYGFAIGFFLLPSPKQSLFTIYMFIPLYLGVILSRYWLGYLENRKLIAALFVLTVGGVLANPYIAYPWVGFEYSIGGVSVETSREWWSGDAQRYAGFARASYDAATQIVIMAALALVQSKTLLIKGLVIGLSGYAIWLTNAKTVLVVLAVVAGAALMPRMLFTVCARYLFGALAVASFSLVLWGGIYSPRLNALNTSKSLHSFEDRLRVMWPEALDLWFHDGTFLTGRGLGGIGTGQTYFEPTRFNAADNLFLYVCVSLGLLGLAMVIYFTTRLATMDVSQEKARLVYVLALVPLTYGLTANVIENALLALVLGVVCCFSILQDEVIEPRVR